MIDELIRAMRSPLIGLNPAEETIQKLNGSEEAQKAIRAFVNPTPPPQPAPDQPQTPKYDRQQFDRLIGNQR